MQPPNGTCADSSLLVADGDAWTAVREAEAGSPGVECTPPQRAQDRACAHDRHAAMRGAPPRNNRVAH